jgi:hypothetical protein
MRRQCAPADRAGNDARKVEHLDAGERAIGRPERFWRRVADFFNAEQREFRHRAALRVTVPFGERSARGHDKAGFGRRGFQRLGPPTIKCVLHRLLIMFTAKQLEEATAMMRQISMQPRPTAITAAVKSGNRVVMIFRRLAIDAQIALAAKLDGGTAHVDADALPAAGA